MRRPWQGPRAHAPRACGPGAAIVGRLRSALTRFRPPRVADSRTLVCKGMFGKHTDLTPFLRMRVTVGPDSVVRARRGGECCYAR